MRGLLFLVVGPSGVGKDSLIDGARRRLAGDPRIVMPARVVTRPAGAGGEDHLAMSEAAFAAAEAQGAFCLSWRAHGLAYGIPASAAEALAAGRSVVANVSRAVIPEARRRLAPLRVVAVTAPAEILAARLHARAREDAAAIAARLARADAGAIDGPDVLVLRNAGSLEDGISRFTALLLGQIDGNASESPLSHPNVLGVQP
ncbi:phosphonate metabolism protein/1,5-bisphosphokinase (PRPP-forming) PhnN [Arenibaculum pallidiluteum]|uniref:phosphonate metabolism protein/1,5-bisphosphokinase (PRPP-forming) PhnN n=1 Tax=Arenibaculum pallidiluteum TaxID=2812559 RepID=UPI001A958140|nr:phosphonate metabolism protein/1,5-bisphosphokinase (PRPP-forming) PhnN [Arenibaculum pallidiluteum]